MTTGLEDYKKSKENKAEDVRPITQDTPKPRTAARLNNFPTGQATLLPAHKNWLDGTVGPILRQLNGTWVDLIGYASKLGNADKNMALSAARVEAVRAHIAAMKPGVNFQKDTAHGEEQSTGDEWNDDGYFRAVEVYVYGFAPPPLRERRKKKLPSLQKSFTIQVLTSASVSVGMWAGDAVSFKIVDTAKKRSRHFWYTGGAMGFDLKLPLPKILPGIGFKGDPEKFTTSRPCEIEDFEGEATFFCGPGISLGPVSVGGVLGLSLESSRLVSKQAVVGPKKVIEMRNNSGVSIGFGTAGKGRMTAV